MSRNSGKLGTRVFGIALVVGIIYAESARGESKFRTHGAGRWTAAFLDVIFVNAIMFNAKRSRQQSLTPLEQFIMEYVWAHPNCTAETCREGVAKQRALKDSTIRTILRKLEEKGYASHRVEGRTFVYRAVDTRRNVAVRAAQQLIERFCDGSVEDLLVGMVDNQLLQPKQLRQLAEKIASRKEKRA